MNDDNIRIEVDPARLSQRIFNLIFTAKDARIGTVPSRAA